MSRQTLTEARQVAEATPVEGSPGRFLVQLITPGWGASGYYSDEVLETAATGRIFPAGLHMYLDHPTVTEHYDRPERSLRDLSAVLTEDARWTGDALVAEAAVFGPHRDALTEMREAIGVSIRAVAETEHGEAEGRRGVLITELVEAISADFVTHAGRGGRIVEILESARPGQVVDRAIAHGITEATANELRHRLQEALRDAYGGEESWVWVRDFDASNVWYEHETPDDGGTYQHNYTLGDDDAVELTGSPVEVRAEIRYVPVTTPAGQSTTSTTEESTMPQIEEARLRQLEEAAGRVTTLEAERDAQRQRAETAERERNTERARNTAIERARTRVSAANANLHTSVVDRIVSEATREVPLTDQGALDESAFDTRVDAARTAEETYLASLSEAAGAGSVVGLGTTTGTSTEVTREAAEAARHSAFGRTPKTTQEA